MKTEERYRVLFEQYDNEPSIVVSEQQLGHEILALTPESSNVSDFEKAELFAFQFVESYRNKSGDTAFYKPHRSRPLSDGTEQVYPDIAEVTPSMMQYWQFRAESSLHPVVKARYAGLVHEFCMRVTSKNPKHTITRMFSKATLEAVRENLITVFAYKAGKLQQALSISLKVNDMATVQELKGVILELEQSVPLSETKNFWTYSFDMLVKARKNILTVTEETDLISRLEQRLTTLITLDNEAAWEAANRLVSYYHSKHDKTNVLRVLTIVETALTASMIGEPSFQKIHWLERLYKVFDQYSLRAHAVKFLVRIREESQMAVSELKGISGSTTVNQSEIDQLVNAVLQFQGDQLFVTLAMHYCLDKEAIEKEVERSLVQNPIYSLFKKDLLDAKGRKIGVLPPYHEDPGPYIAQQAVFQIKYNALFFRFIMDEAVKRDIISTNEIIRYVCLSSIFQPANMAVIERAVNYYLSNDHVGFIHTIIPQIEEGIRNLIEKNGGNVLVEKDGFYLLRTLDHLLGDSITIDKLGASTCLHLRSLLTDKTGMNLRNDVAHGIIGPDKFKQPYSDALMIAVFVLVFKTILE